VASCGVIPLFTGAQTQSNGSSPGTIGFLPRNYAHHYLHMSLLECVRSTQEDAI